MIDSPHRQAIRAAFDKAADTYDGAAQVQREVCRRLDDLTGERPCTLPEAALILDAGCGTGFGLPYLATRFPTARVVALDFAPSMLRRLAATDALPLEGDIQSLPLADGCIQGVWSSLALQWCRPEAALAEFHRVLAPGAQAWIATLGPATLGELRAAFTGIDEADHVIAFRSLSEWEQAAQGAGFHLHASRQAHTWATAPTLRGLLRDIKAIGAHSVGGDRRRAPLGKAAWRSLEARYEHHRRADGQLPATYDLILLHLEKPR